jgi:hypothetical protein
MTHVTHNAPLLTTLTHTSQLKSVAEPEVYSKVIHNLKTAVEKPKNFSV